MPDNPSNPAGSPDSAGSVTLAQYATQVANMRSLQRDSWISPTTYDQAKTAEEKLDRITKAILDGKHKTDRAKGPSDPNNPDDCGQEYL